MGGGVPGGGVRLLDRLAEAASVHRAFGDPVERDGSLVIPVARVVGGGGAGEGGRPGTDPGASAGTAPDMDREREYGSGGGFGLSVSPAGVFVVRDGNVTWQPAVDVNRIVLGVQVVAVIGLLVIRSILRQARQPG
jgi:uncharacterized spore protein YtfJ